jgi:uncharacterized membrane protein YkvA (DUF1232 family)
MALLDTLRQRARHLKTDVLALYLAARHPRTPWYARLLVAAVVAYALSPIDLIPDFIPVLGYLDDLILVPLGIALAIRLVPDDVMTECRARAADTLAKRPVSRLAAAIIIVTWVGLALLALFWGYRAVRSG